MPKIELIQGDCLEVMDELIEKGVVVDAIITDPPYGTTACKWDSVIPFDEMWLRLNKLIKQNGAIVLFGSEPFSSALRMSNIKNYKYDWKWLKEKGVGFQIAKYRPMMKTEDIMIFCDNNKSPIYNPQMTKRNKPITYSYPTVKSKSSPLSHYNKKKVTSTHKYPESVIQIKTERGLHPTQKPVALMEYLIKTYTNEGETVLDFTMGSGTTGVACKNLNRSFIGIELDPRFFKIAEKRINENL